MSALLSCIGLEKKFGAVVAASDINVTIHAGESLGIIGANGAGKTTFINMITGYLHPSKGKILFKDRDITNLVPRKISRIGICRSFQIPQLLPELTVMENMLIALVVAEEGQPSLLKQAITEQRIQKANATLMNFGIENFSSQDAGTVPQGVKKLLDIAMATAGETELMLLDEPTSGVSSDEKMSMMANLIPALKKTGSTVVFIEHDMEIVEAFAPRVIAFYEGRILADGTTETVLNNNEVREFVIGDQAQKMEAASC